MDKERSLTHLRNAKSKLSDARREIACLIEEEIDWSDEFNSDFEPELAIEVIEALEADCADLIYQLENQDDQDHDSDHYDDEDRNWDQFEPDIDEDE